MKSLQNYKQKPHNGINYSIHVLESYTSIRTQSVSKLAQTLHSVGNILEHHTPSPSLSLVSACSWFCFVFAHLPTRRTLFKVLILMFQEKMAAVWVFCCKLEVAYRSRTLRLTMSYRISYRHHRINIRLAHTISKSYAPVDALLEGTRSATLI